MLRMKRRTRIRYTDAQKALMWDRWQKGELLHQNARPFDRHHSCVRGILAETGGIRPATRRRPVPTLSLVKPECVSWALVAGHSIRSIATTLGRAPSTISREIQCNGNSERDRASHAEHGCLGPSASARDMQVNAAFQACCTGGGQVAAAVVAAAARRLADALLSVRCHLPGIAQGDLAHALYPVARNPQEGVAAAPSADTGNAALATPHPKDSRPRSDQRYHLDPGSTGRH